MMPAWTDIGGFWVSAGGFALAIILAIVGWVQAHGAKKDAKVAKRQAKAARDLADEAKKQTAVAEAAAQAAKEQAEATVAAFAWETVPQLSVLASRKYPITLIEGQVQREVDTSDWYVVNNGKAAAVRLSVRLDFGSSTQIGLGPDNFSKLDAGESRVLGMNGVTMPAFEDLIGAGYEPTARLKYDTPTGQARDETVVVKPGLQT